MGKRVAAATLRALLEPRRLVPVALVSATLVLAQHSYSDDPRASLLGVAMCAAFVLVAPVSFTVLAGERPRVGGALLYALIGVTTVLGLGVALPRWLQMAPTFLTAPGSLVVDVALFLVGGWGLGRDIALEASLERERQRAAALALEAERAGLLALRAQLDPHFLFNTLNAIAEWCRADGETAERAVLELAKILRAVLEGVKDPAWPLEKELELVQALLSLHALRDPEALQVTCAIQGDVAGVELPPMLLFPLAENAVKHGRRGHIELHVDAGPSEVHVALENPGPFGGPRAGSHGLPTVERRLALAYGTAARLEAGPADDAGRTRVTVRLPRRAPERAG